MVKVQSQAGISLGPLYDVPGSNLPIDQIDPSPIALVHEMGATMMSERMSGRLFRMSSGAINQSTNFDQVLETRPGVMRVLGVQVFTDANQARLANAAVMIRDDVNNREIPIWATDAVGVTVVRMADEAAVATELFYSPSNAAMQQVPNMLFGDDQPQAISQIAFRGTTTAFGAGTFTCNCYLYIGFAGIAGGGVAAYGLPVPSW